MTYLINYTYEHGTIMYAKIVVTAGDPAKAMIKAIECIPVIHSRSIKSIGSVEAVPVK